MPLPLEVGVEAPEFLSCQGNWNEPIPAVDHNGNEISIKDFEGKCLALFFVTEAREQEHREPVLARLKMMDTFATKYKNANVAFVAAGVDDLGMMRKLVEKAEINFPYIPLQMFSPMGHEYNAFTSNTSAFTYVICDGKIQQSWNMDYPAKYDESHFEEVLAYIATNNLA